VKSSTKSVHFSSLARCFRQEIQWHRTAVRRASILFFWGYGSLEIELFDPWALMDLSSVANSEQRWDWPSSWGLCLEILRSWKFCECNSYGDSPQTITSKRHIVYISLLSLLPCSGNSNINL